jgi:hypothetical protein
MEVSAGAQGSQLDGPESSSGHGAEGGIPTFRQEVEAGTAESGLFPSYVSTYRAQEISVLRLQTEIQLGHPDSQAE